MATKVKQGHYRRFESIKELEQWTTTEIASNPTNR